MRVRRKSMARMAISSKVSRSFAMRSLREQDKASAAQVPITMVWLGSIQEQSQVLNDCFFL